MEKLMLLYNVVTLTTTDKLMLFFIALLSTVIFIFVGYTLLQVLQISGYKMREYFSFFVGTKFSFVGRLFMLSFLSTMAMLMTNVLLKDFFIVDVFNYFGIFFLFLFSVMFVTLQQSQKQKTPLKLTKRMVRLVCVTSAITFAFAYLVCYLGIKFIPYLSYGLVGIVPLALPLLVALSNLIMFPIEKLISISFIKKSKEKLQSMKNLKVIGITGSFGKTTVKNILKNILSEKYKVCSTPSSYNTPMGLSKTILENLSEDDEIFIAEMGARHIGDIDELCNMVCPNVGVITGIGNQHLLTFGTINNIIKAKGELADYVTKNEGKLFINVDSENAMTLSEKYPYSYKISMNGLNSLKINDVLVSSTGSEFTLEYVDESIRVSTSLIGEHNISNIYLASVVAMEMGLSLEQIANGIKKIKPIPHRLEILNQNNFMTIIDDSYNCSVEGSEASLNVLSKFAGRKIVITPGMIELGEEQYSANYEFGKKLANICDYVIVDAKINYQAISDGLLSNGFEKIKIIQTNTLADAVEKLKTISEKGDIVLFENDLPDTYN